MWPWNKVSVTGPGMNVEKLVSGYCHAKFERSDFNKVQYRPTLMLLLRQKMSLLFLRVWQGWPAGTLLLTHQNEFSLFVNLSMDISLCFLFYTKMLLCIAASSTLISMNSSVSRSLFQCTYKYIIVSTKNAWNKSKTGCSHIYTFTAQCNNPYLPFTALNISSLRSHI